MSTTTARRTRQPQSKPTMQELYENYQRDAESRRVVEAQYNGVNHARTAYLLSHVNREDITPDMRAYWLENYDALEAVEQRYRAELAAARTVEDASWSAWMAAMGN